MRYVKLSYNRSGTVRIKSGRPIKVETEPAHKVGHVHTNMNKYTVNLEFKFPV